MRFHRERIAHIKHATNRKASAQTMTNDEGNSNVQMMKE
jgi:hypothetical protein